MRTTLLFALFIVACSDSVVTPAPEADADVADGQTAADGNVADASNADSATEAGPVVLTASNGSGGIACNSTRPGLARPVCVATTTIGAATTEYRFVAPADLTKPVRLVLYLHGDGARAHSNDGALKALVPWADGHASLAVSVLSPNGCAWWQKSTQRDCTDNAVAVPDNTGDNADLVAKVIDTLRAKYNIVLEQTLFYGSSGGSIMLSQSFLRKVGDKYPGAYALNCGGEKPALPFAWPATSAQQRGATKLYFTYGDQDFLKPKIEVAIPYFTGLGFATDTQVVAGATHCAFDGHGRAQAVFNAYLGMP